MSRVVARRRIAPLVAFLVAVAAFPAPALAAANDTIKGTWVSVTPFSPNGDGYRDRTTFSVTLTRTARVTVTVVSFDRVTVRTLASSASHAAGRWTFAWDGRNGSGALVPNGPYRFRVVADNQLGRATAERPTTKAPYVVFAARPAAIVVAIDPGHGGSRTGAVSSDGYRESDFNLDIGLRLRAMLAGAGVQVAITRTTDTDVNEPAWDRTGDGVIEYRDELASRPDVANQARADVFISLHNNIANDPRVGGPTSFYHPDRVFSAQSYSFARFAQTEIMTALRGYRTSSWTPYDHGVQVHPYYVIAPYKQATLPRPTLMPGLLVEGLFLSHPYELSLLKQPRVRQSMAVAYYNAIARYIAGRSSAAGYSPMTAPRAVAAGATASYSIQVTNRGTSSLSGSRLVLSTVPAVTLYDGSGARGVQLGSAVVPTLAPGATAAVTVSGPAPATNGDWLVKGDIRLSDGRFLSDLGSPVVQLPLRTGTGSPSPSPSASPSVSPSPSAPGAASPSDGPASAPDAITEV